MSRKLVEITVFSGFSSVPSTYTKGKGLLLLSQGSEMAIHNHPVNSHSVLYR